MQEEYDPEEILRDSEVLRKNVREFIEKYPSVKKVALSVVGRRRRGSPATVSGYVFGIQRLSAYLGLDPEAIIQQTREGRLNLTSRINAEVTGFIDSSLNGGLANKTVWSMLAGIKRWAEVNEAPVDWEKVERPTAAIVKNRDRAPTPVELRQILAHADVRETAIISLMATSGLRVGTCVSLRWRELDFSREDVVKVTVEREIGRKFGRYGNGLNGEPESFTTFGSTAARTALLAYRRSLEEVGPGEARKAKPAGPNDYVFLAYQHQDKHLTLSGWQWRWYRILRRAGLAEKSVDHYVLRTHSLRKYFRTRSTGLDESFREHMMGHRGRYLDSSYLRATEAELYEAYAKVMPKLEVDVSDSEQVTLELSKRIKDLETQRETDKQVNSEIISNLVRTVAELRTEIAALQPRPKEK